ncbi:hypothetical protein RCO48_31650 [Peribacillus frigoritolerans]|nr:hypothetical protein [Peribacillus frigoritolerans]
MPLSSKYGNTVQNVKTCIGEHVCSCDKQQSLLLAVDLEKKIGASINTIPYKDGHIRLYA